MAVLNSTILEKAWLEGTNDFQQRIPNPTVSGMAATVDAIFDPYNNDLYNGFTSLLNGIMMTYVYSRRFENPLREMKKPARQFGNTERMVAVKYMQAHSYKTDDETLLKLEMPEYREWFFSVNYKTRYEFSWPRADLARAFAEDGYGFNELMTATLDAQISSDQYDEMNTMIQQFATADALWTNGLFRVNLSAAPTTADTTRELLVKIKAQAGMLRFPSTRYNAIDVPIFENSDTLVLWVTPEVDAYLDVMALAELFNVERAEVRFRKVVIPEFPIPNVYAALTSEDFVYMRDVEYGVYPFWNPGNLSDKFYLHHQAMVGANPAAACILFTTDAATNVPTVEMAPTGMSFSPNAVNVTPGGKVQLNINLTGTVDPSGNKIAVEPDAAIYSVSAVRSVDDSVEAVQLGKRTYVDARGILHVQKTGVQVGDIITITATSRGAYVNPSGNTTVYTATATATVTAAEDNGQKECQVETEPYITYTDETEYVSASE